MSHKTKAEQLWERKGVILPGSASDIASLRASQQEND